MPSTGVSRHRVLSGSLKGEIRAGCQARNRVSSQDFTRPGQPGDPHCQLANDSSAACAPG